MTEDPTWQLIRRLGYAGLIPFVFLALCLWLVGPELHPYVALSMQGYGAVIVSFLGGIHWGVGFRNALITPALAVPAETRRRTELFTAPYWGPFEEGAGI